MGLRNRSYRPERTSPRQSEPLIDTPLADGRQALDDCCVSTTENFTAATEIISPVSAKPQILVCSSTAVPALVQEALSAKGYGFTSSGIRCPLSADVRSLLPHCDIVLLDVTTENADVLKPLEELHAAIGLCNVRPRVLCFSTAHRNSQFVLEIEKAARFVRVGGPEMLLEAVDLLLAEINQLDRSGPCFQIVHRFSQGTCAPGEEIAAIFLAHNGNFFQLPLALAQRFVFDFLAQHRRIALDSLQIVSGLSGDWFYRDHAANSGHRQAKKIRRPTVKVLVQRIREAMESAFAAAHVQFNPADVLRSCPAEGSKRVLYKLHADVRWRHLPLR